VKAVQHPKENFMTDIQELEIGRYYSELKDDVHGLVDKYLRIADWDIPDNDEEKTLKLIISAVRKALDDVEKNWNGS
jgi:hypothetical protein